MSEIPQQDSGGSAMVRNILLAVGGVFVILVIVFMVHVYGRFDDFERKQAANQDVLAKKLAEFNSQNQASLTALAQRLGMTQQELKRRAAELQRQEKETAARVAAQAAAEEQTKQQLGAITGEVSGVKGDVGKVRDDVTSTRSDLETTKSKLEHAIGDLNRHSELIATSHDELELLKHRGDRNYFEFTLTKGKQPTHVGTVNLELKNADPKKSKFTLYVLADDKKIEKKDRSINEPLQFYTGRDHNLYEVVINTVDNKNQISGYLSTPKGVAVDVRQN
jgi:DNA repair exonuclease SbcCD ATPase subunit